VLSSWLEGNLNSGYYAACAGLRAQSQTLELIANNLANVNTTGYRGEQPRFRSLLAGAWTATMNPINRAINDYNVLGGTHLDRSAGNLQTTGNSLDFAIEGDGYFAVQTKAGPLYTRNGNFQVSARGELITAEGDPVLGQQKKPIILPAGEVAVSADGTISVNGAVVNQVQIVRFSEGTPLDPQGSSYYAAPDGSALPATSAYVRQGTLESSNVNPVLAMVQLISVQRHAEMMQRALSAYYSDFNRIAADDLPRV
jgi:flagellar basal-body rod protein FlgF